MNLSALREDYLTNRAAVRRICGKDRTRMFWRFLRWL